jgi:hypothetical protein
LFVIFISTIIFPVAEIANSPKIILPLFPLVGNEVIFFLSSLPILPFSIILVSLTINHADKNANWYIIKIE